MPNHNHIYTVTHAPHIDGMVLYDVVAVSLKDNTVRVLEQGKTARNANAIVMMAVWRRGVETEFFSEAPAGKYHDGDIWRGT